MISGLQTPATGSSLVSYQLKLYVAGKGISSSTAEIMHIFYLVKNMGIP